MEHARKRRGKRGYSERLSVYISAELMQQLERCLERQYGGADGIPYGIVSALVRQLLEQYVAASERQLVIPPPVQVRRGRLGS